MAKIFTYCPFCATALNVKVINDIERKVCPACDYIQWRNPVVGVAIIVMDEGRILLGKRSRGQYKDHWCIPCGYVEYHEEIRAAAAREFLEETGLEVRIGEVYTAHSNFHNPDLHTVGIWFHAEVIGGELAASDDLVEVEYFPLDQLPELMAFPTDLEVLRRLRDEAISDE